MSSAPRSDERAGAPTRRPDGEGFSTSFTAYASAHRLVASLDVPQTHLPQPSATPPSTHGDAIKGAVDAPTAIKKFTTPDCWIQDTPGKLICALERSSARAKEAQRAKQALMRAKECQPDLEITFPTFGNQVFNSYVRMCNPINGVVSVDEETRFKFQTQSNVEVVYSCSSENSWYPEKPRLEKNLSPTRDKATSRKYGKLVVVLRFTSVAGIRVADSEYPEKPGPKPKSRAWKKSEADPEPASSLPWVGPGLGLGLSPTRDNITREFGKLVVILRLTSVSGIRKVIALWDSEFEDTVRS
ncbi:hypothetical protein B0H11DRAFT_1905516 [Mycena galericulata]|nr:hypothetical protein B0H11DRAFT_1905516 [Mycena galericulata]